jgi:hypothetical protein
VTPFPINLFDGAPSTAEFGVFQNCNGLTVPAGGSCTISYTFSSSTSGVFEASSSFIISNTTDPADGEDFDVSLRGSAGNPGQPPAETSFSLELTGKAKVKGETFKADGDAYALQLSFDTAARTFLATDEDGTVYAGNLAPKNKKGNKFSLFLDDGSSDAFSTDVAARGAAASGLAASGVLGESSKLTLRLREDGSASLDVKSEVLVNGLGPVLFKARLAGAPPAPSE